MDKKDEKWLREEKYGGEESEAYHADVLRLRAGEPLAYVIGHIPFLGLSIRLDSKPLIPRPETEWWTERLIAHIKEQVTQQSRETVRVLDLCAGSGAVGLAILAQVPEAHVTFAELDAAHAATIRSNIEANGLDASRTSIVTGDLFAPLSELRFDVIATNPPYISDTRALDASVTDYEPHVALYGGEDGLALIRRIAHEAPAHLSPGGELWVEVDSEHAESAQSLVAGSLANVELIPDQYGRPRLVVGYC